MYSTGLQQPINVNSKPFPKIGIIIMIVLGISTPLIIALKRSRTNSDSNEENQDNTVDEPTKDDAERAKELLRKQMSDLGKKGAKKSAEVRRKKKEQQQNDVSA